jgi:hypothetical protein
VAEDTAEDVLIPGMLENRLLLENTAQASNKVMQGTSKNEDDAYLDVLLGCIAGR